MGLELKSLKWNKSRKNKAEGFIPLHLCISTLTNYSYDNYINRAR